MHKKKLALVVVLVLAIVALLFVLPTKQWAFSLYEWSQANPSKSMVAFVVTLTIWITLALPGVILVLTGGYVFGFPVGYSLVLLGHLGGSTFAFLISRKLGRRFIEGKFGYNEKFRALDFAIKDSSFSIVFLARLSMILPYSALNYVFGLTSVALSTYIVSSFLGMLLPFGMFAFLGSTADDLAAILNGDVKLEGSALLVPLVGVLALIAIVWFVVSKAKQALSGKLDEYDPAAAPADSDS